LLFESRTPFKSVETIIPAISLADRPAPDLTLRKLIAEGVHRQRDNGTMRTALASSPRGENSVIDPHSRASGECLLAYIYVSFQPSLYQDCRLLRRHGILHRAIIDYS
jgi:hypothetical protein